MIPKERRALAWAMFESIPYEHRLGVRTYGGETWAGALFLKGHRGIRPTLDQIERNSGDSVEGHPADE